MRNEKMNNDKLGLDRILFFSDAIFAIAITLLALNIKFPEGMTPHTSTDLAHDLWALSPQYQSYITSFLVIGLYWMGHHHYFRYIRSYDYTLIGLNLGLLMCIAFLPFPTAVLDSYSEDQPAVIFYASSMAITGLMKSLIWWYAASQHRLIDRNLSSHSIRLLTCSALVPPFIFLVSIAIAFFNPSFAKLSWISIVLILSLLKKFRHSLYN
jgi:uncharacterized membrane protein